MISKKRIVYSSIERITKRKAKFDENSKVFESGLLSAQEMVCLLTDLYIQGYLNRDDMINIAKNDDLSLAFIIQLIHLKNDIQ